MNTRTLYAITAEIGGFNLYYVYKFINSKDEVIYIGKAKNIFNRLSNHYSEHSHISDECYVETRRIFYCKVTDEEEAKNVEKHLASKYKPKYNDLLINSDFPMVTVPLLDFCEVDAQRLFKLHSRKNERMYNKLKSDLSELHSRVLSYMEKYPDSEKIEFIVIKKTRTFQGVDEKDIYDFLPINDHFELIFKYLDFMEFKQIKVKYDIWGSDSRFAMRLQDFGEIVREVRVVNDYVLIGIGTGYIQIRFTNIQRIEFLFGDLTIYGQNYVLTIW